MPDFSYMHQRLRKFCLLMFLLGCNERFFCQLCHGKRGYAQADSCPARSLLLVFEDDFSHGQVDQNNWHFTLPWGNHSINGFNYSSEYFTNGLNYGFDGGNLKLIAKSEKIRARAIGYYDSSMLLKDGLPNLREWQYTSGMLYSKEAFGYGKFEVRCKIPKGKGFWSAFMLFGEENDEIDVFEFWNEKNILGRYSEKKLATRCHMTTHANGKQCSSHDTQEDFSTDFHTYTVIWNCDRIEWYIDNVLKRTSYKYYDLFRRPVASRSLDSNVKYVRDITFPTHNLHISVGLSVQAGKNSPDEKTPFPASLEIDYIRYWKFADEF